MTIKQAAAYLAVSQATLRRLIYSGLVTAYQISPRRLSVSEDDLEVYLQSVKTGRRMPATSEIAKLNAAGAEYFDRLRRNERITARRRKARKT